MSEVYKYEKHVYHIHCRVAGKPYCLNCGMILLRNDFTEWCEDKGCNYKDHPQFNSARKRLTGWK